MRVEDAIRHVKDTNPSAISNAKQGIRISSSRTGGTFVISHYCKDAQRLKAYDRDDFVVSTITLSENGWRVS